jgi:hypothetical protein
MAGGLTLLVRRRGWALTCWSCEARMPGYEVIYANLRFTLPMDGAGDTTYEGESEQIGRGEKRL